MLPYNTILLRTALLTGLLLLAAPAAGQYSGPFEPIQVFEPDHCAPAKADAMLDIGNVRARILNNGNLFWRSSPRVYEVPKGSGNHAFFVAGIWVGGVVQDTLRMAGTTYGPHEFWAGPLDADGNPPDDCALYDRLFEINRNDIEAYNTSGTLTANLREWPWQLGAPVIDGDGDPDNYDLAAGDRPALMGDQMLWWVMNDRGGGHLRTQARPLGLEIHGTAYAFAQPHSYVGNTTFYRYKLIYKGEAPLEEAFFSMFADTDLGQFDDDYVGSDPALDLTYSYNADDDDDRAYGKAPPAVGFTVLRGPTAQDAQGHLVRRGLHAFAFYHGGGGVTGDPAHAGDMYNLMQGRWRDGKPFTIGGYGRNFSNVPTRYHYPGDPVVHGFWTELNVDDRGTANEPSDRRSVSTTGPFRMEPGDVQEITWGLVWSRGQDHLDSVTRLKIDTARLHEHADVFLTPRANLSPPAQPRPPDELGFAQNYPNPFTDATTIRYSLPQPMQVRLAVYDVLGREVATLVDADQEGGVYSVPFAAGNLPPGVYLYRIEMDHLRFSKPMTLIR